MASQPHHKSSMTDSSMASSTLSQDSHPSSCWQRSGTSTTVDDFDEECTPETDAHRIIFMIMMRELEELDKSYKNNNMHTQELSDSAARFLPGYWIFVGPCSKSIVRICKAERWDQNIKNLCSRSCFPAPSHKTVRTQHLTSTRARSPSAQCATSSRSRSTLQQGTSCSNNKKKRETGTSSVDHEGKDTFSNFPKILRERPPATHRTVAGGLTPLEETPMLRSETIV